jgi:hypothetical protein
LHLRASENRRLTAAFGIENSLTTEIPETHKAFLEMASGVLNKRDRSWDKLYTTAEAFLEEEIDLASQHGQSTVRLAESVRCMVLAVVLLDSFRLGHAVERSDLATITNEINSQWLKSKCNPDNVTPSDLLNSTIASLHLESPDRTRIMTPAEALGLLMPQYETLWRVVLLTFVTAYHHQPAAYADTVERTASVPHHLGDPSREAEALKLAQVSPPPFPLPFLNTP